MVKEFVHIGNGYLVAGQHIRSIDPVTSAPTKREIQAYREAKQLTDATNGRRTRSLVTTTCGHAYLSIWTPETIGNRAADKPE